MIIMHACLHNRIHNDITASNKKKGPVLPVAVAVHRCCCCCCVRLLLFCSCLPLQVGMPWPMRVWVLRIPAWICFPPGTHHWSPSLLLVSGHQWTSELLRSDMLRTGNNHAAYGYTVKCVCHMQTDGRILQKMACCTCMLCCLGDRTNAGLIANVRCATFNWQW